MNIKSTQFNNHCRASSDNVTHQRRLSKDSFSFDKAEITKLEKEHDVLLNVVKQQAESSLRMAKVDKIRVQQWCSKLSSKPNNSVWRKNINFHLKVLLEMIKEGVLSTPFSLSPCEGPLPNLNLQDICYPIRKKFQKNEKNSENKSLNRNRRSSMINQVSQTQGKKQQIAFHKDNISYLYPNQLIQHESLINSNHARSIKYRSNKSSRISHQKQNCFNNFQRKKSNISQIIKNQKNNSCYTGNQSVISRRLFDSDRQICDTSTIDLKSWRNQKESCTVQSFQGISNISKQIPLLIKVYQIIKRNNISESQQAQQICRKIKSVTDKLGYSLQDPLSSSSFFSQSSANLMKVSENIRMKFLESDEETIKFMSFLQNLRIKKQ